MLDETIGILHFFSAVQESQIVSELNVTFLSVSKKDVLRIQICLFRLLVYSESCRFRPDDSTISLYRNLANPSGSDC